MKEKFSWETEAGEEDPKIYLNGEPTEDIKEVLRKFDDERLTSNLIVRFKDGREIEVNGSNSYFDAGNWAIFIDIPEGKLRNKDPLFNEYWK